MRGRYEVEDLLKLRASPLVAKPPGLPPKEEWMGPSDPRPRTATTKNKIDDAFNQIEGFQKRPTLLDSSRRSTTDPERIHLGPPRNSFASSNTARTRNGTHERTKTNEDVDEKFTDRRSGAFGGMNNKLGARVDDEYSGTDRPRRRNDDPDLDGRPKRDFDRSRWNRDNQVNDERADEGGLRNGREGYSRAKFDQPWTRREKPSEVEGDSPAWRRGQRDKDFHRNDAEPEWADSIEVAESAKAHTHEDFLQWMEKMKNKTTSEDKPAQLDSTQKEVAAFGSEKPPPRVVSDSSASVDKFFAKFEKDKSVEANAVGAKPTKSRFASIFGSKDEPKQDTSNPISNIAAPPPPPAAELEQPTSAADPGVKANNDAAFAKLLEMLNKNQAATPPAPSQIQSTRSPVNVAELASTRSPDSGAVPALHQQSTKTPVLSHTPNMSLDRLIESRSPANHARTEQMSQPKAGPQDLLDLLRRSNIQERQPLQQQQPSYPPHQAQCIPPPPPPGLSNIPSHDIERQNPQLINTRRDNPRSIFDDPAFSGYRSEPEMQQRTPQPKDHGGLGGLFAAMNSRNYASNSQQDQRTQALPNPPPGLQRPPGLDRGARPPPGWPSNSQQQRPQPRHLSNAAPQQPMYNQAAYPQHPQAPRQMPQRKPTNEMPLPPGFASIPPGFGPSPTYASPTSPDSAMQFAMRGGYGPNEHERMEQERQQSAFAAMYGTGASNRGGSGGVQLPPGFR
ncbi:hypothetical protein PMZ80_008350 [Knufia obscura]|uniref:Uncharacterized protein n=1 Tax=Knufia obscura TaxID=1635080 RepID=A0ABR0REJ5_9EURO|nr:hypothetical protein PMZ80_008350 [Knufia obscura]